ncbi:ATP-grasp domain-containing protein [Metabacillus iocasae]|uniref:ATP-grasp domain-containing protein n=1 Tax=Priestia iocasae TaxID=2291674 RepID=A0ABS2QS41_9BACI|nr:ATP-grasp domain-containing protein [Metabacillus iocasae]MBM7702281.1 hypothetical protein [Metabacillus iocasae]
MSILILNRNAPYPFHSWLEPLEEELLVLTTSKRAPNVQAAFVEGYEDYEVNGCIELKAAQLHEKHHYHTIVATSEYDIYRAAKIRDFVGIKGQSSESALAFRNKVVMKNILEKTNIAVPTYREIDSAIDLYEFVQNNGFPIIVKPIDGSGSEGVTKIDHDDQLYEFVRKTNLTNLEVEAFIEGDMYHIDGLFINGEVAFSWPSKYMNGCLSHQAGTFNGSYLLDAENLLTMKLNAFVKQVLHALPTPEHIAYHAEVFVTPDEQLVFCEIACRRGGGYIAETIQQAFDIDLTKVSVQAQCGIDVSLPRALHAPLVHSGFLLVPAKKGLLLELPSECNEEWVTQYEIYARAGDRYGGAGSSLDNIATFLVKGKDEQEVKQRIESLAEWFDQQTKWLEK